VIWKLLGLYIALTAFTLWCGLLGYAILIGPTSVLNPSGFLLWLTIVGALLGQFLVFLWGRLLRISKRA
jgi:hypothetical protein